MLRHNVIVHNMILTCNQRLSSLKSEKNSFDFAIIIMGHPFTVLFHPEMCQYVYIVWWKTFADLGYQQKFLHEIWHRYLTQQCYPRKFLQIWKSYVVCTLHTTRLTWVNFNLEPYKWQTQSWNLQPKLTFHCQDQLHSCSHTPQPRYWMKDRHLKFLTIVHV